MTSPVANGNVTAGVELEQYQILEQCGFMTSEREGGRKEQALEWEHNFVHRTGSPDTPMSRSNFVADMTQRGYDPAWSLATFRGTDIDGSGAINLHEYILSRAALDYDADRDSGTPLVDLRLRVAYFFYDSDGDGKLNRSTELRELVRELAAGDSHVDRLMQLLPTEADELTLEGFVKTALGAFHAAGLSSRDLLRKPTRQPQRTVLEPRTVVAGLPFPLVPSAHRLSGGGGGGGASQKRSRAGALATTVHQSGGTTDQQQQQQQLEADHKRQRGTAATATSSSASSSCSSVVKDHRIFVQASAWSGAAAEHVRDAMAANEELHMDPVMTADSTWRGPLLSDDKTVVDTAALVVGNALKLMRSLGGPDDAVADDQWLVKGHEALCVLFGTRDPVLILRRFQLVAADAQRIVAAQPPLVLVRSPAKLFGDTHGQLRDLLVLFREFGFPSHRGGDVEVVSYVFNGDFVDRGDHQLEVVALLFALKVSFPTRVWLLRGNHEFRWMNEEGMGDVGFAHACRRAFPVARFQPAERSAEDKKTAKNGGSDDDDDDDDDEEEEVVLDDAAKKGTAESRPPNREVAFFETSTQTAISLYYEWCHEVFDWLPLAALVGPPTAEPVLVLHGGIGDGSWGLEELRRDVPRPLQDEGDAPKFVKQALWSDPSDSDAAMAMGVHGSPRGGGSVTFGPDVTEDFCVRNRVSLIVRSHQFVDHGYKVMHRGHLLTVFSARNYFMKQSGLENDSAVLLVAEDDEGNLRVRPKRLLHLSSTQPAL